MSLAILLLISVAFAQQLSAGDRIRLICEQEPTLSVERTLAPDGCVDLPILGRVNLGGKFPGEVEAMLESLAMAKLKSESILISVSLVADESSPIQFSGAVTQGGSVSYRPGITLADIVKIAVPTVAAATEAVEITSASGRKIVVDLSRTGGETRLRPGDRVVFPRAASSNSVLVLGGVLRPGSRTFEAGMTVRSLIALGGGITGHAQIDRIKLKRGQSDRTIDLDSPDADAGIERGDIVFVPMLENGRFVTLSGFVKRPGLVELHDGMTLSEAIRSAGGFSAFAGSDSITVRRMGEWKRRFDFAKISSKQEPDLLLAPDDMIDVPVEKPKPIDRPKPETKNHSRSHPVVPPL